MIIVYLLAIYAISYWIRNLDGPFSLFSKARNILLNSSLGVFFYNLLSCPWCVGFHCGYIVYLLGFQSFSIREMILWSLAGSALTAFLDNLFDNLSGSIS